MLRHYLLLLSFVAIPVTVAAQSDSEEPSQSPSNDLFALEGGQVGLFQNSVNLFSGEVSFSLPLVSLPGRGGMNANVAISYSSAGVRQQMKTWNLEAPTSVLGLGWQLDIPKVVVDHKQTGTRTDDEFFLIEGGVSNPLVLTEVNGTVRTFASKNFKFWDIQYDSSPETWTITKEDGMRYIYGDNNSTRSTVQYHVKWDNWIGSSSEISGQQQQAMQWDLSEVRNLFGDAITFSYEQVSQKVGGAAGLLHTEASYLTQITNPQGQTISLVYKNKTSSQKDKILEYQEPHTEVAEPDAYQERYERRYLDRIEVRHLAGEEVPRYRIDLRYVTAGAKEMAKRLLTSVQKTGTDGVGLLPPLEFAYQPSGDQAGAMYIVTTSQGPQVEYTYGSVTVAHSQRDFTVEAPDGYAEPQTWIGNDYVVVAWRQLKSDGGHDGGPRPVKVKVYQWAGRWIEGPEEDIDDVGLRALRYSYFDVVTGKDFFGVQYYDPTAQDWKVKLYHQMGTKTGEWKVATRAIKGDRGTIHRGDDFVVLATAQAKGSENAQLKVFTWNGSDWKEKMLHDKVGDFFYTAANNYVIAHNNDHKPDEVRMYYQDELGEWKNKQLPNDQSFQTGEYDRGDDYEDVMSFWHAANGMAVWMAHDNDEAILQWDENYNLTTHRGELGRWNDRSSVFITNNSLVGVVDQGREAIGAYRYDGQTWHKPDRMSTYAYGAHVGNDFFIRSAARTNSLPQGHLHAFDPNTSAWQEEASEGLFAGEAVGNNYAVFDNAYLYRFQNSWKEIGTDATSNSRKYGSFGLSLFAPATSAQTNVTVSMIRNGAMKDAKRHAPTFTIPQKYALTGAQVLDYDQTIGSNIVILYPNNGAGDRQTRQYAEDATTIIVYKVSHVGFEGEQVAYPVTQINVHDGYRNLPTTYAYTAGSATMAPGGYTAQFNEVKVLPGTRSADTYPYGYTAHYFFNGLPPEEASVPFPEDNFNAINAANHYQKLLGMPYAMRTYDRQSTLVAESQTKWHVYSKLLTVDGETDYIARGYYARVSESTQQQDGFTQATSYLYDQDQTGQANLIATTDSQGRQRVTRTRYATDYEDNTFGSDLLRARHVLTPVLEQEVIVDGQTLSKSQAHYTQQSATQTDSPPVLEKTVVYPAGSNEQVTTTMRYDAYGNLLERQTEGGLTTAYLYGYEYTRPVAEAAGATSAAVQGVVAPASIQAKEGSGLRTALEALRTGLPAAHVVTRTYDPFYGNVTSMTDPLGRTTRTHYDDLGRLHYVEDPDGYVQQKMEYSPVIAE